MTTSASTRGWTYAVFLSFRGTDTRRGFTGTLYDALRRKGIHTFMDDEELPIGSEIAPSLLKAIEESKIAIVVFSKDYASSPFCLNELVHILECRNNKGLEVIPIFYKVEPSDVRYQKGSYEKAFATHEEKGRVSVEKLDEWKNALKQVADLSGRDFKGPGSPPTLQQLEGNIDCPSPSLLSFSARCSSRKETSGSDVYEYKFINDIVEKVSNKIECAPFDVAYTVGLESRVIQVMSLLHDESNDGACIVGIYGSGGIGKTTLAYQVFNLISRQFKDFCFLEGVRNKSLVHLQETLLSKIIGDTRLGSYKEGITVIKRRLSQKKVLLVLDDVDDSQQLEAIVGGPGWFGIGSKVIITTRDQNLLELHGVNRRYEVKVLNENDALKLLSWKAFKSDTVDRNYEDIFKRAVTYASGLPLALEVVGSNLFGKSRQEWESALDQWERIPDKKIQDILKVSFESLKEPEKEIFLDLCLFNGCNLTYVKEILYANHDVLPEYSIRVLIDKSLIKISHSDSLTLHDLIEDMGKEIVRKESPKEPGKRSRLCFHGDIVQVLKQKRGTSTIQILILDPGNVKVEVDWDGKAFEEMNNLKTLIIRGGCFSKGPKHLPKSLKVLEWREYPSKCLPSDFYPNELIKFELTHSCMTSVKLHDIISKKKFVILTTLSLENCQSITEIPDLSDVPNLESLSVSKCENLINIHESVGFLDKLRRLSASGCKKLSTFPRIKLTSLEFFDLSYCESLERFPKILGDIEGVTELHIFDSTIRGSTCLIHYPSPLAYVGEGSKGTLRIPTSTDSLGDTDIDFRNCTVSHHFLPKFVTWLPYLTSLTISHCCLTIIPSGIKECRNVRELRLDECKLLREIEGIPPNLESLYLWGCLSLKVLDLSLLPEDTDECRFLTKLDVYFCHNLQEIIGIPSNLKDLEASTCKSLSYICMLLNQELNDRLTPFMALSLSSIYFEFPPTSVFHLIGLQKNFNDIKIIIVEKERWVGTMSLEENLSEAGPIPPEKDRVLLKKGWNDFKYSLELLHHPSKVPPVVQIGFRVFKQESCMEDTTNPHKKPKLNDDLIISEASTSGTRADIMQLEEPAENIGEHE